MLFKANVNEDLTVSVSVDGVEVSDFSNFPTVVEALEKVIEKYPDAMIIFAQYFTNGIDWGMGFYKDKDNHGHFVIRNPSQQGTLRDIPFAREYLLEQDINVKTTIVEAALNYNPPSKRVA